MDSRIQVNEIGMNWLIPICLHLVAHFEYEWGGGSMASLRLTVLYGVPVIESLHSKP